MRSPRPAVLAALLLFLSWPAGAHAQLLHTPCPADYAYQCQGLACACVATQADAGKSTSPSTSPFDLIWDIDQGTANQSAAGSGELLILITPRITSPDEDASTCTAIATVAFYGSAGNLIGWQQAALTPSTPAWVLPAPPVNAGALRKTYRVVAGGTASGCAVEELPRAILTVREPEGSGATRVVGARRLASTWTPASQTVPPVIPAHVFPPAALGASPVLSMPCSANYTYQCQGLACACVETQADAGKSTSPSTSPFDLIWDIADGTANQAGQTLEVMLGLGPQPAASRCRVSGRVEIVDPDASGVGVLAARDVEMAPGGPILAGLAWAHPGGEARRPRVQARLRASDCLLPELAGAELLVATHDTTTGRSTGPQISARPLLIILAEEGEGDTPLPIRPAYGFPPGPRLEGGD